MNKLYNTQGDLATDLIEFFTKECDIKLTKPQMKVLPHIILGMIISESAVTSDIARKLKGDFSLVQTESVQKRIYRFFNNNNFNIELFYHKFIMYIISKYKCKGNRVHIALDHMFSNDDFTVLFFSLRIGRQGIPLWFKCFKGIKDNGAFKTNLITEGIKYISDLFAGKDYNLIFTADRWFSNVNIMKYIESLDHVYCFRIRKNFLAKFKIPYVKIPVFKMLDEIYHHPDRSRICRDIPFTADEYITNLVFGKSRGIKDPWVIATNGDPKRAIKDYGYRFGSIECIFKNHKSNGFYLEETNFKNVKSFSTMFGLLNVALTWLSILGSDYSKNKGHAKVIIRTTKVIKGRIKRVMSIFETGLTYFNLAFNNTRYFRIKTNFVLYDI